MDRNEGVGRSWRRIAYKLKGEGLWFHLSGMDEPLQGLLIGTTERGFLVFDPESSADAARVEPFERVRGVMPLPETRTLELRAAFERSAAAV